MAVRWRSQAQALLVFLVSARTAWASKSASIALRVRGGNVPTRVPAAPVGNTLPWQPSQAEPWQPYQQQSAPPAPPVPGERQITDLSQRDSRVGFIRKVYAVLAVQLLVTAAAALAFAGRPGLVSFFAASPLGRAVCSLAFVAALVCPLLLFFFQGVRRDNLKAGGLLTLFTAAEALLLGLTCSQFRSSSVMLVLLQTGAAVAGLTAYAFQPNPNRDLTVFGSTFASAGIVLLATGLAAAFFQIPALELAYSAAGAILFSFFIVHDTQKVVGGEHRSQRQLDSRDWAVGALTLYLDVINLFYFMLRLLGERE